MTARHHSFVTRISMRRGERGPISAKALEAVLRNYPSITEQFLETKQKQGNEATQLFLRNHYEELSTCFCDVLGHSLASLVSLGEHSITGYELRFALAQGKDGIGEALQKYFADEKQLPSAQLQALYHELADTIDATLIKSPARKR